MIFRETPLKGAYLVDLDRQEDERGFFARAWCQREFEAHGLNSALAQCNISFNQTKGTMRGMHYQLAPHGEAKLVRCIRGAIYDVIIDLRPTSPTYLQQFGVELRAETHQALFVPEEFAHGFLTLADHTEVFYQMSAFYAPGAGQGFRWNDPAFNINWPGEVTIISERDATYPDFSRIDEP